MLGNRLDSILKVFSYLVNFVILFQLHSFSTTLVGFAFVEHRFHKEFSLRFTIQPQKQNSSQMLCTNSWWQLSQVQEQKKIKSLLSSLCNEQCLWDISPNLQLSIGFRWTKAHLSHQLLENQKSDFFPVKVKAAHADSNLCCFPQSWTGYLFKIRSSNTWGSINQEVHFYICLLFYTIGIQLILRLVCRLQ